MSAIETLRAILVAGAAVAAVLSAAFGQWSAALILLAAVGVHGYATRYVRRLRLARGDVPPPAPTPPA